MCGILGLSGRRSPSHEYMAIRALELMKHRGPDSSANWADPFIWLGHNRLSIVDLTDSASQPMADADGRYRIILNGEIYNYKELKTELQAICPRQWKSSSDTEVMLEAFKTWGAASFSKLNGMWAAAIYNSIDNTLILTRDRFGVKPLYWAVQEGRLVFASEIKSILAMGVATKPNWDQISRFLTGRGCDSGEDTTFLGINALAPGHWMEVSRAGLPVKFQRYWSLADQLVTPPRSYSDRVEHFRYLFEDAVRLRLRTDVNTGVALSGGLDSSSVFGAAEKLMRSGDVVTATRNEPTKFRLFSIANSGSGIDESRWIKACLDNWNEQQKVVWVEPKPEDFVGMIEDVIWHQEAPVWSSAVFAFHSLYKKISESGTRVILEGHGSDEMLGGYPHLAYAAVRANSKVTGAKGLWNASSAFQETLNPALQQVRSNRYWTFMTHYPLTRKGVRVLNRVRGKGRQVTATDKGNPYVSDGLQELAKRQEPMEPSINGSLLANSLEAAFFDEILPIVLRVVDRASSAYSVESRAPFLDYRLVQYVFSLADSDKIDGHTKQILRDAAQPWAPPSVTDRTAKVGFSIDAPAWFSNSAVSEFIDDTFASSAAINSEVLNGRALIKDREQSKGDEMTWTKSTQTWEALNIHLWHQRFFNECHL